MCVKAVKTHPCSEVHSGAAIEEQRRHIHVSIVSGNMQRRESTLQKESKKGAGHIKKTHEMSVNIPMMRQS